MWPFRKKSTRLSQITDEWVEQMTKRSLEKATTDAHWGDQIFLYGLGPSDEYAHQVARSIRSGEASPGDIMYAATPGSLLRFNSLPTMVPSFQ